MPGINPAEALQRTVTRMLHLLSTRKGNCVPLDTIARLHRLDHQLSTQLMARDLALPPATEREFYSIIESHAPLRLLYFIILQEDILENCNEGLRYFAELQKRRPLFSDELERLRRVEEVHQNTIDELEQLRQELLDDA